MGAEEERTNAASGTTHNDGDRIGEAIRRQHAGLETPLPRLGIARSAGVPDDIDRWLTRRKRR